jgi:hypothetical protein
VQLPDVIVVSEGSGWVTAKAGAAVNPIITTIKRAAVSIVEMRLSNINNSLPALPHRRA